MVVFSFLLLLLLGCQPRSQKIVLPLSQSQVRQPLEKRDSTQHLDRHSLSADSLAEPVVTHIATVKTSMGTFRLGLYGYDAPLTVYNFLRLANRGFYDRQHIHRIAKDFVIQFGDPQSRWRSKQQQWGSGGRSIWKRPFEDELNPLTPSYRRGYHRGCVAMANRRVPNTNTSQVFICLRDLPQLPKKYTIFGRVLDGMEVIDSIAAVPIIPVIDSTDGRPAIPVRIHRIRVRRSEDHSSFRFPDWVRRRS